MTAGDTEVSIISPNAKACAIFNGDSAINVTPFTINSSWTISFDLLTNKNTRNAICGNASTNTSYIYIREGTKDVVVETTTDNRGVVLEFDSYGSIENKWISVLITLSPSAAYLYIDNTIMDNSPQIPTDGDTELNITKIGSGYTAIAGSLLDGGCTNIKIWNKVLSEKEREKNFDNTLVSDGLIHYWKLETDYTDSVGTAHGTNSGTRFGIVDENLAAQIKADRVSANDVLLATNIANKQVATVTIEEAP